MNVLAKSVRWIKYKVHVSRIIGWFCVGILLGVALVVAMPKGFKVGYGWIFCSALLVAGAYKKSSRIGIVFVVMAGIILGMVRGGDVRTGLGAYDIMIGKRLIVSGVVIEDAVFVGPTKQRLVMSSIAVDGKEIVGKIWVTVNASLNVKRSDRLTVEGVVGPGFGTVSATVGDTRIVSAERVKNGDLALSLRDWFAGGVRKNIEEPEASLALGFLVGQRSSLPESLGESLRVLGLTHIIVASGYNLTILVRIARRRLLKYSRYTALIGSLGVCGLGGGLDV